MRPTTLKKRHSVSVWIYVVHAVLGLGAVVLLHARVAVDREGYATPTCVEINQCVGCTR